MKYAQVEAGLLMFNKIAFVCLGNICRSPTAEAIAKGRVADRS